MKDAEGRTKLMISTGKEDVTDVEMLTKYRVDTDASDTSGETELDKAAERENMGWFEELKKNVYYIQSNEGQTNLHCAVRSKKT